MLLAEYVKMVNSTRDTVYFYIEKSLLSPKKQKEKFNFTEVEIEAYKQIYELKILGFTIDEICLIKETHETKCGKVEQIDQNIMLVEDKINIFENKIKELQIKSEKLLALKSQMYKTRDKRKGEQI